MPSSQHRQLCYQCLAYDQLVSQATPSPLSPPSLSLPYPPHPFASGGSGGGGGRGGPRRRIWACLELLVSSSQHEAKRWRSPSGSTTRALICFAMCTNCMPLHEPRCPNRFYSPNACEPALCETALYETACIECPLFGCARMSLIWVLSLSLSRRYLGIVGAIFVAIFR